MLRFDRDGAVGVQSRFRAGFDPHDRPHIGSIARFDLRIPDEQCLPVWIGAVDLHTPGAVRCFSDLGVEEFLERTRDVSAARVPDCIEPGTTPLIRQNFQLLNCRRLVEVISENGDVNVLRKAINQPVGFRQRGASLEQEARRTSRSFVIERIQRPADPEILFDISDRRAEAAMTSL